MNFKYNGQRNLPSLQQLTPFSNLTDPQYPVIGNPGLKPSFTNTASLGYEESSLQATQYFDFGVQLGYVSTGNTIISNISHPRDSSQVVQQTTYLNAGTTSSVNADYHISLPSIFPKSFKIYITGTFNSGRTPAMTDGLLYNNQNWSWNQSVLFSLVVPDVVGVDLGGGYAVTHADYPGQGNLPSTFKSASLAFNGQYFFSHTIILEYALSQPYNSSGDGLQAAPASLTASLQFPSLLHNKVSVTIAGYNLLNSDAGTTQVATPNGTTQSSTAYAGRSFFCSIAMRLSRFGK